MNFKPLWVAIILSVFLAGSVNAYTITYIGRDEGGTTLKPNLPSIYWNFTCESNLSLRYTAGSSGAFSLNNLYLSPGENTVSTSNPTFTSNISCHLDSAPIGGGSTLADYYESSTNTTHTAQSINTWVETLYDCDFNGDERFIYNNTRGTDSWGNHPFGYGLVTGITNSTCYAQNPANCQPTLTADLSPIINRLQNSYYSSCGVDLDPDRAGSTFSNAGCGGIASDLHMNYWILTPFYSGASGFVNISIFGRLGGREPAAATLLYEHQFYLWDTVTNGTTNLGTVFPLNSQLNLIPEREYWLFIGTRYNVNNYNCGGATFRINNSYTDYSITVWAYEPDWNCGEWSDCIETTESRVCVDANDRVPDKVEYRTCALGVTENATLGFEEYTDVLATLCRGIYSVVPFNYGAFTGYSCVHVPYNVTTSRPLNWTVTGDSIYFNRYFMDFTSEWATEGSRSLKMWTIPPKQAETSWSGTEVYCTNVTTPNFPIIENTFDNTSMSVAYNVTFPATNMRLRFDAKRCNRVVEQHGELAVVNLTWGSVPLIQIIACPQFCYGSSCDNTPTGQFYYDLRDNASNSLFGETQWIDLDVLQQSGRKATIEYDLSFSDIVVGLNYTLSFAVYPRSILDTNGNCVMLDNVRYDVLEQSFLSILNNDCSSQCLGETWYEATQMSNGGCLIKKVELSDICVSSQFADEIANNSDFCIDSSTLKHYNSFLGDYEDVNCENGCSDNHCISDEEIVSTQEQEAEQEDLLTPLFGFSEGTDFWGFAFLFSKLAIGIIITFFAMIVAARWSKHGEIGLSGGVGFVLMFWYAGIFPAIIGLLMTVCLGIILAKMLTDRFLSTSGGG